MIESVREDILKVTESILQILKNGEFNQLKKVSDHTIHSASIFQDEDSTTIAVIAYALSKLLVSCEQDVVNDITKKVQCIRDNLKKNNYDGYKQCVKGMFKTIATIDESLRRYIEEVIQYAEIKKGARIYEHGISMARAAEILGISEWDLMNYVGKTTLIDSEEEDERERLEFTRKLFRVTK